MGIVLSMKVWVVAIFLCAHGIADMTAVPQESDAGLEEQKERLADSEAAAAEEKLQAEEASAGEQADLENEMAKIKMVMRRRAEERATCEAEVNTLAVTDDTLTKVRETRTKLYAEAAQSVKEISRKAKGILDVVKSSLKSELRQENTKDIRGEDLIDDDGFQQSPATQLSGLL